MSAKPVRVEDPNDPEVILRDLPVRERAEFLRQYREAVDVAHDPLGYGRLQRLLHVHGRSKIVLGILGDVFWVGCRDLIMIGASGW